MFQKDVARRIGVTTSTIYNWENGRAEPGIWYLPALIAFLGYNPLPPPATRGHAIKRGRISRGWSRSHLADLAEVDEATIARLELDTPMMARRCVEAVQAVLVADAPSS